jgi:hypothetical protein
MTLSHCKRDASNNRRRDAKSKTSLSDGRLGQPEDLFSSFGLGGLYKVALHAIADPAIF